MTVLWMVPVFRRRHRHGRTGLPAMSRIKYRSAWSTPSGPPWLRRDAWLNRSHRPRSSHSGSLARPELGHQARRRQSDREAHGFSVDLHQCISGIFSGVSTCQNLVVKLGAFALLKSSWAFDPNTWMRMMEFRRAFDFDQGSHLHFGRHWKMKMVSAASYSPRARTVELHSENRFGDRAVIQSGLN